MYHYTSLCSGLLSVFDPAAARYTHVRVSRPGERVAVGAGSGLGARRSRGRASRALSRRAPLSVCAVWRDIKHKKHFKNPKDNNWYHIIHGVNNILCVC